MLKGFKDFILKGNVIDLATAVIIASAFTAIVTAFTTGVVQPIINTIPWSPDAAKGLGFNIISDKPSTFVNIGDVITAAINFVIVAAVVYFVIILPYNKLSELGGFGTKSEVTEVALLTEIRDLLDPDGTSTAKQLAAQELPSHLVDPSGPPLSPGGSDTRGPDAGGPGAGGFGTGGFGAGGPGIGAPGGYGVGAGGPASSGPMSGGFGSRGGIDHLGSPGEQATRHMSAPDVGDEQFHGAHTGAQRPIRPGEPFPGPATPAPTTGNYPPPAGHGHQPDDARLGQPHPGQPLPPDQHPSGHPTEGEHSQSGGFPAQPGPYQGPGDTGREHGRSPFPGDHPDAGRHSR